MSTFYYECTECHTRYDIEKETMLCPKCAPLNAVNTPLRGVLEVAFNNLSVDNNFDIHQLLPIEKKFFPKIPVGKTPLWTPENIQNEFGFKNLYIKDDSTNPTASFKDRASFLVAAFANKFNIKEIVLASTGNAASSMAGIGAAMGIKITIFLPKTAPKAKMVQSLQYGANVILVNGNYDLAFDISLEYSKAKKILNRNTAYNPMTIEGKKSVSLEIFKDLGRAPDCIFVPVGDGVIISGVYKGLRDLLKLGLIKKIPEIYAVQAEGSDAIFRAFNNGGHFEYKPTSTIADSICVDVPRCGHLAIKNLQSYNGKCITVTDDEILEAQKNLSEKTGLFSEPAGATSYAGFLKVKNTLSKNASIVILTTGSGLKDIDSALTGIKTEPRVINSTDDIL